MTELPKKLLHRPRIQGFLVGLMAAWFVQAGLGFLWDHRELIHDRYLARGYSQTFVADEVGLLAEGAGIYRNGVKIGVVEDLGFAGPRGIALQAKIFQGKTIPKSSLRTISETGFGGPRMVQIMDVRVAADHPYFQKDYAPSDTINLRYETGFLESILFKSTQVQAKIDSLYRWGRPEPGIAKRSD